MNRAALLWQVVFGDLQGPLGTRSTMSSIVSHGALRDEGELEADDVFGDHSWHYRYNRRLSCFQHCVTSLTFSQDGKHLVSGTGSGDVKVWDTSVWAEAARLKQCSKEEPRALAISPAQRWLVVAHSSVMNIYNCEHPWRLEYAMPALVDQRTKETSEWHCIAFSPMSEVDHPGGHAGQDNHLAVFASNVLCVLDYSGGWSSETPKRTRSVFNSARPTTIAYTACGFWLVCGFEVGQLQIWNHFSLTLERTLSAHTAIVHDITASPRCAPYDPRFVSCSADRSLRVWHSAGWCLEQIVPDTKADRNGIRCCTFSSSGNWLVSVATELCLWSVCVSGKGKLELRLHQRLDSVCGAEDLRTAAFCSSGDAIAVGSQDGVLSLWTKLPGTPADNKIKEAAGRGLLRKGSSSGVTTAWIMDRPLLKPMMHVTPEGQKFSGALEERHSLQDSQWFVRSDLRSLARSASASCNGTQVNAGRGRSGKPKPVTPNIRAKLMAGRDRSRKNAVYDMEATDDCSNLERSCSVPELKRWKSKGYEFEDVLNTYCNTDIIAVTPASNLNKTMPAGFWGLGDRNGTGSRWGTDGECNSTPAALAEDMTSLRKSMMRHATQGIVRRISLDPQSIC